MLCRQVAAQKMLPDTINIENGKVISIKSERLNCFKNKNDDVYNTRILFKLSDSSNILVNYKGQYPLVSNKGYVVLTANNTCQFAKGKYYSLRLAKQCLSSVETKTFYNYFAEFNKDDCSLFKIKKKTGIKTYQLSYLHSLFDINNHIYEISFLKCLN